jgi:hypothetical protein
MQTHRQNTLWEELMKFTPTPDHLATWNRHIKVAVNYQKVIDGLSMDKLMALWKTARQQKSDPTPAGKKADPVLKNIWLEHMQFAASETHLALLEKHIAKETNIDDYFGKVTVEDLIVIVREVALGQDAVPKQPAPPTQPAQPNLNLSAPEGK